MLIRKGEIYRNIDENRLPKYKTLGYEKVEEKAPVAKTVDKMTADELKAYAAEKNIDITGITSKADILAKIKEFESGI